MVKQDKIPYTYNVHIKGFKYIKGFEYIKENFEIHRIRLDAHQISTLNMRWKVKT
jgi:hypothetical protein